MRTLAVLALLGADGGRYVTTNALAVWQPAPYHEAPLEEATTVCGYGGPATIDPDDAGHWWLRCSTSIQCGNGAQPTVQHRRDGGWQRQDFIICDARKDAGQ